MIAKLGERTDTSDAHGQVIQQRPVQFNQQALDAALEGIFVVKHCKFLQCIQHLSIKVNHFMNMQDKVLKLGEARPITVYGAIYSLGRR